MIRTLLVSASIVFGIATSSQAQVKLQRKMVEGATTTVETTNRVEQKLTIAGMDTETNSDTRAVSKVTTGKRDVAGMIKAQEKIESLNVSLNVMGQNYSFDSTSPDVKGSSMLEVLRDLHKALSKRTTTIVYGKDGRIHAIESDQDLLNSLPPELQANVKSQLDPEFLKKIANQELDQLPSDPVNVGDSWQRTEMVNFGAGQVMTFQKKYTYQGTVDKDGKKLDKITVKALSVDFALQDSPLPLQLKGSDLKADQTEGTILFNRDAGYVVEAQSAIRITGDIMFAINGMDLPSQIDLKLNASTVVKR
jgi:hypothetical protein